MPVIFIRIDDRLIHGQVVEGWLPFLDIDEVVVVSEAVAQDEMRKALMRMSMSEDVGLKFMNIGEAAQYLSPAPAEPKILVLAPGPAEILGLIKKGVKFTNVNVGGMHFSLGKAQIGRAIFLDNADISCLREIASGGIKLEGRAVPTDTPEDVIEMLEHHKI